MIKQENSPKDIARELRGQLASEKRRLGFFFGAGTSMAVGLPGIIDLTKQVQEILKEPYKAKYIELQDKLPDRSTVEDILDRVRLCREYIGYDKTARIDCFEGTEAQELDHAICRAIHDIVSKDPKKGLDPQISFSQWLYELAMRREWPVEIFTTNYDLLFEKAMEKIQLPFFDGFIGAERPFFAPASVEADRFHDNAVFPPSGWTRLWKIHGSIGWRLIPATPEDRQIIIRAGNSVLTDEYEQIIFPSREKYSESRKLPFIAYHDRLRKFLSTDDVLMVILGYDFSDQHINDTIFQALNSNPGLAITALVYGDRDEKSARLFTPSRVIKFGQEYRHMSVIGPDKACIGGIERCWDSPDGSAQDAIYWDKKNECFALGDFGCFAKFLQHHVGFEKPFMAKTDSSNEIKESAPESS